MYFLGNARTAEQRAQMTELQANNICTFCPPHIHETQQVLAKFRNWTVVRNAYPYPDATEHLLLVPVKHVTEFHLVQDVSNLMSIIALLADNFPAYQIRIRSGELALTGGTVEHLHVHFIGR